MSGLRNTRLQMACVGLLTLITAGAAVAAEVTTGDTFIYPTQTLPQGSQTSLSVIASSNSIGAVQFGLSSVPAGTCGTQIAGAQLTVFVNKVNVAGTLSFYWSPPAGRKRRRCTRLCLRALTATRVRPLPVRPRSARPIRM